MLCCVACYTRFCAGVMLRCAVLCCRECIIAVFLHLYWVQVQRCAHARSAVLVAHARKSTRRCVVAVSKHINLLRYLSSYCSNPARTWVTLQISCFCIHQSTQPDDEVQRRHKGPQFYIRQNNTCSVLLCHKQYDSSNSADFFITINNQARKQICA